MKLQLFRYLKSFFLSGCKKTEKIKFDFLLPIGSSCQTRYQIERFLKYKYKLKQPACFFDWLGLGGVGGVAKMIANDFSLNAEDFQIKSIYAKDNFAPIHMPTGFRFQHDFGLNPAIKKDQDKVEKQVQEFMTDTLEKYLYIGKRTRNIIHSGKCIGLIYYGRIKKSHIAMLFDTLSKHASSEFYILNILKKDLENSFIDHEKIINISINQNEGNYWKGCNKAWDTALSTVLLNKNNLYSKVR